MQTLIGIILILQIVGYNLVIKKKNQIQILTKTVAYYSELSAVSGKVAGAFWGSGGG